MKWQAKKLILRRETAQQPRPVSLDEQALEKVAGGTSHDSTGEPEAGGGG